MHDHHRWRGAAGIALAAALSAALTTGCALGPDYARPAPSLDADFINAGAASVNRQPVGDALATFWRSFDDPLLGRLVEQGLAANGDIRIASARLQEARANQAEADASLLPSFGVQADATRGLVPLARAPGTTRSERTSNAFDVGFIANWELDFFGRLRRGSEAARALTAAGEAGLGAAQTSVAAEIARNYLELRGLQQRRAVAEQAIANQRDSLRIADARLAAGRATQLDVTRARVFVASTEATLPALQQGVERAALRLATLTAQAPRSLLAELTPPAPLPGLPVTDLSALPVGTPQQWLERRPDVLAAERQLAAATAGIGIARAELFPRVSLSGLLGLNAGTLGNLAKRESFVYSLGASLSWTPFDFGRVQARVSASEARSAQSLANYEQVVMAALEETEAAFSAFNRSAERAQRLAGAVTEAQQAARLARLRYEAGYSDFLIVLDAEREVLSNRDQLAQAQAGTATALVAVYRALGGGWVSAASTTASK